MTDNAERDYSNLLIAIIFPVLLWVIHSATVLFNLDFVALGILPRRLEGLPGIIFSPLIHENFEHLISNTAPLFILGLGIFYFYPNAAFKVFVFIYLLTDTLVWIFAREAYHIGASGIVYGFVSFLFFSGVLRRDTRSIALALLVIFLYGGLVWGVFPSTEKISWESHLSGLFTGLAASVIFKKLDPVKKYDWEDDEEDVDPGSLEISHDPDKNKF